jgi:hypothetical protein
MSIDRRITNGLAWAGVFLVVGVPTADLLSAQFAGPSARAVTEQVAVVERVAPTPAPLSQRPAAPIAAPPVAVAAVAPATPVAEPVAPAARPAAAPLAQSADAVNAFLQSGRPLPSYITGATTPAAPVQVAATPPVRPVITTPPAVAPAAIDPIEVASIAPQKVAPTPMPLSMRPQPVSVALVRDTDIVIPPGLTPAAPVAAIRPPANIDAIDLEDWETGPLSDFLARKQAGNAYVPADYDEDGFFLDQGPNRPRRDRIIAREAEPFIFFAD